MESQKRWLESVGNWTDSLNLFVATTQLKKLRLGGSRHGTAFEMFKESLSADPNPIELHAYLTTVVVAWSNLILPFSLLTVGIAYVGDKLDGIRGNHIGLGIGMLPLGICLVGGADALWRRWFAKAARRHFLAADSILDAHSRRLIRIARANDATIVLQTLAGLILAVTIARS